jgi:putative transposase
MARRKELSIPDALLDQSLAGADPKTAFDPNGLLDGLKKALAERVLNAEMDHHLAGESGNSRNGYGSKTVLTDTGRIELSIPRDRQATFDPQLIAKYQRRFPGFDGKIVSMYARGMSTREITGHLRDLYGIEVSPDLISAGRHRCGAGGGRDLAGPPARACLPAGVLRRAAGQDQG